MQDGLLNEAVEHCGDAQRPLPLAVRFGNVHPPDRLRNIRPAAQLLPDARPVPPAIRQQLVDRHPVDARCPIVVHHTRVRGDQVLSPHHLLDECERLVPIRVVACRARLTRGIRLVPRAAGRQRDPCGHLSPRNCVYLTPRTRWDEGLLVFGPSLVCVQLLWPRLTPAHAPCVGRSPRVRRVTVAPSTRRIYAPVARMTSGFECMCSLAHHRVASSAVRAPRAGVLPAAAFPRGVAGRAVAERLVPCV